jgi:hypothetical protein
MSQAKQPALIKNLADGNRLIICVLIHFTCYPEQGWHHLQYVYRKLGHAPGTENARNAYISIIIFTET